MPDPNCPDHGVPMLRQTKFGTLQYACPKRKCWRTAPARRAEPAPEPSQPAECSCISLQNGRMATNLACPIHGAKPPITAEELAPKIYNANNDMNDWDSLRPGGAERAYWIQVARALLSDPELKGRCL